MNIFAKSHAALRAHLSWCKVSSCDRTVLDFGRARTTLVRRTLMDNTSRWTLSFPNFNSVPGAFGKINGVFRWNRFSRIRILRCRTNTIVQTPSIMQLILSQHLSSTSCWAFLLPQHVGNDICRHIHNFFQTCNSDTREDVRIHMTDFTEFESAWNIVLVFRVFLFIA